MEEKLLIIGCDSSKEKEQIPLLRNVKVYAEKHAAIFIFLLTVGATAFSHLVKILYYAYKFGFNFYFNISNNYLKITDNAFYELLINVAVCIVLIALNFLAVSKLEKRKLFKYLSIFALIMFIIIFFAFGISSSFKESLLFYAL